MDCKWKRCSCSSPASPPCTYMHTRTNPKLAPTSSKRNHNQHIAMRQKQTDTFSPSEKGSSTYQEFTMAQSYSNGVRLQWKPFYHKSHTTYHPKKLLVKPYSTRCTPACSFRQILLSILPPNTLLPWLPEYSYCVIFKLQKWAVVDHNENGVL